MLSLLRRALVRLRGHPRGSRGGATARRQGPVILMYHRVATPPVDPWGLAVAPERFRDQLAALKSARKIFAMDDFMAALSAGDLPPEAVAITFDDGYRDNLVRAAPLLAEVGAPATIFLTGGAIGRSEAFWWDELARMILVESGPVRYALTLAKEQVTGDIRAMAPGEAPDHEWRAWEAPRTERQAAYRALWVRLQRVRPAERAAAMAELRRTALPVPADADELPMSEAEVARLGTGITIGAHAMTHQPLTTLPPAERRAEIGESRALCAAWAGRVVTGFAFPHGDCDVETSAMVREAGFAWACSTRAATVDPADFDPFELPRLAARDITGTALLQALGKATI